MQDLPILITPSETRAVKPKGKKWQLEELQSLVEGYIQIINLGHGRVAVVNEEGKLRRLPFNEQATFIYRASTGSVDYLCGNVLITPNYSIE